MIELRWIELLPIYADVLSDPPKKLQYRWVAQRDADGNAEIATEWITVPTVKCGGDK